MTSISESFLFASGKMLIILSLPVSRLFLPHTRIHFWGVLVSGKLFIPYV